MKRKNRSCLVLIGAILLAILVLYWLLTTTILSEDENFAPEQIETIDESNN